MRCFRNTIDKMIFLTFLSGFAFIMILSCSKKDAASFYGPDFSFNKPDNWTATENVADTLVYYEKQIYDLSDGAFNPVISISGGENAQIVPENFMETTEKILFNAVLKFHKVYSGNYKKTSNKQLIYTGLMGDTILKWDMIFFVKNKKSYIVTYTCLPEDYELYLQDFYKTADSFKLK